jgi:hypothetical protein
VIVVLDSTVLVADPVLRGVRWKTLAHWGVRLCITEVVLQEAIAGYGRRIDDAGVGFEKWASRHTGALDLESLAAGVRRQLSERKASYAAQLRSVLNAIPVDVLPIPDVDHNTLIHRATGRVRPCKQTGDGYRDTLNWFSLLALAEEGDRSVFWVTDDGDFSAEDEAVLHPELQAELNERGLQGRIALIRSVHDAASVVASHLGNADKDLRNIEARLAKDVLTNYIRTKLLAHLPSVEVRADDLALPPGAESPLLFAIGEITDTKIEVKAALDGEETAVEVGFTCNTTILTDASEVGPGVNFRSAEYRDEIRDWEITKPVRFTALLTVDHHERPTGGEITSIRALEDDPGFAAREANGDQVEVLVGGEGSIPIGPIYLTRDYVKQERTYPQGRRGIVLREHTVLGKVTHVDLRLPDGEFLLKVPIDYIKAEP